MSKKNPPRHPMKGKKKAQPPMSERIAGGDPWEKETKPDEDYRLLAKRPGMQMDDYVDFPGRAAGQEAEAVPKLEQDHISEESANRFSVIKAEEEQRREARSAAAQVRELYALARKTGSGLPEIQKAIDEARKRLGEAA